MNQSATPTALPTLSRARIVFTSALLFTLAALLASQTRVRERVGPLPDGGFLLNSGWRVQPVGAQIPLSTMPMSSVLSNDGRFLIVLNGGYLPPSLSVIDVAAG